MSKTGKTQHRVLGRYLAGLELARHDVALGLVQQLDWHTDRAHANAVLSSEGLVSTVKKKKNGDSTRP